jgi:hypothetical protein
MHSPVPLPSYLTGEEDIAALREEIEAWVVSEPMRALVRAFGEAFPTGDLATILARLEAISSRHWDFREGRLTRAEARTRNRHRYFPSEQRRQVIASATALGFVDPASPRHARYDHILVLGSYLDACLARAARAAQLIGAGTATAEVCGLTSFRPAEEYDRQVARSLDLPAGEHEFDLMDLAMRRTFGVNEPKQEKAEPEPAGAGCLRLYRRYMTDAGLPVSVLSAAAANQLTRANTADTYRDWAATNATAGDRLLIITTTYFVPFQHCDAIQVLGLSHYRCGIDTIGIDPANSRPEVLAYELSAADHLMEIRSAVRSMRALHATVTEFDAY